MPKQRETETETTIPRRQFVSKQKGGNAKQKNSICYCNSQAEEHIRRKLAKGSRESSV